MLIRLVVITDYNHTLQKVSQELIFMQTGAILDQFELTFPARELLMLKGGTNRSTSFEVKLEYVFFNRQRESYVK